MNLLDLKKNKAHGGPVAETEFWDQFLSNVGFSTIIIQPLDFFMTVTIILWLFNNYNPLLKKLQ